MLEVSRLPKNVNKKKKKPHECLIIVNNSINVTHSHNTSLTN